MLKIIATSRDNNYIGSGEIGNVLRQIPHLHFLRIGNAFARSLTCGDQYDAI